MPLLKRRTAFDDPNWFFELKYDGFRAVARVDRGRTQLISRNGNTFGSFQKLQQSIGTSLRKDSAVLDCEIVCLDRKGKSRFNDLLFRRGDPCFFAFDLLFVNEQDLRTAQLCDRKHELRRLLARFAPYTSDRETSTWYKIRNPRYSQMVGREKLFERERHNEPVTGWHRCTLAC